MAAKEDQFPVILEKDGVKRTAYSPVSYNQLRTQGFTEPKAKSRTSSASAKKTEDKAESQTETKTESKTESKK